MAKPSQQETSKDCYFSANGYKDIDYKDVETLRRFMSSYAKIAPTRRSGVSTKFQRKLSKAVKRARYMALLPYTRR